jgi:isopenicillin N synthase-like dioxygenase
VQENYEEIASFHRDLFEKVAHKLFVLMSIILELPENYLSDAHAYDKRSDDHLRYMIYNVRTQEEWDKAQGYTKGGHTDFGSLTLLFSQHVAGLQIRTPENEWKWVKPVEGGITCNAADTLTFLTKGVFSLRFLSQLRYRHADTWQASSNQPSTASSRHQRIKSTLPD